MKVLLRLLVGVAALSGVLLGTGTAHAASARAGMSSKGTCSGGAIAPGTYTSLKVTGFCAIPVGTVRVRGTLTITENAALDASIPTGTLIVFGGVSVEHGGAFVLGCSPAFGCATTTNDSINGGVRADRPLALIFHSNTIRGHVSLQGGGGGVNCDFNPLFQGPVFSDFEDNQIFGGATVSGLQSCWFGFIRNDVRGTVSLDNNSFADPDAMEVTTNTIRGSLACFNNSPAAQFGDSGGTPNTVTGKKLGECAAL